MRARVEVRRGGAVESVHAVHVAVAGRGGMEAAAGDPGFPTFYRSASKPFQALPLVEDGVLDRFGFGGEELALCCASHNSEAQHLEVASRILDRIGLGGGALECGGHWPLREAVAYRFLEEGRVPGPLESNCSGKHAGMLALAVHHGWPTAGYVRAGHPVQERMSREVSRWTGIPVADLVTGVDGCGVVCFAVPLEVMAGSFARFAQDAARGGAVGRVCDAMLDHPFLVAGTRRLCTDLMATGAGVVAKVGAEGVYGAWHPASGLGIALKVEDGARRAAEPALVAVLEALELLPDRVLEALERYRTPVVKNTRGEVVGEMRVVMELERT
ncbi:MAG TPA: asparaginase [Longimicrobiales bacterium]|nr:asparaginase [Longimicrobiales bacterium]